MKLVLIVLSFFIWINGCYASTSTAKSYVIMDMDTGRVIQSKDKDKPMLIASITKIMTCILAIENGDILDTVKVTEVVNESYGSGIYISAGEEIKLIDLLYGLMLRSGNDAAKMISTYIAGSEDEFVKLMNDKAKELGMKNTHFDNSSGLDNENMGNKSTAYDMALLTRYAMNNSIYREIVKTKKYTVKTNMKSYVWYNKNKLLNYDFITGGKTGYTLKAKRTLVSTGSKNNINLVIVTINDSDDWNTHLSLYNEIFDKYVNYMVINKNRFRVEGDSYYEYLYILDNVYVTLEKDKEYDLVGHIKLYKIDDYDVGMKVGVYEIYLNNELIKEVDIYAKKNETKSFFRKLMWWNK